MNKQVEAFEKLSKLKVGALFMEMGTGKTKVALDLISSKKDKVNFILWICPFSIKSEILSEKEKRHPDLSIEIVGVETIGSSDRSYLGIINKVKNNKTFIVVDESLKIKNREAKRTKRILELSQYAKYKLILNGTPISKNVLDLYTQMNFLSPKILNMSYNEFKNCYCEYYLHGRLKGKVKKQYNISHLIAKIEPYIFDSKLNLEKGKNYYSYEYQIEDLEEYDSIKAEFIQNYDNSSTFYALTTKLQQCYCSCREKQNIINEIIKELNEQVIVFVKFLGNIPTNEFKITGDMNAKEREEIIKKFQNKEIQTLYITYGCGTFGLNFQNCKNIIFAEHSFDYAQRLQAEARIFRLGQEHNVNYYDINCKCGLDELIRGCLNKKSNLLLEINKEIERKGIEKWLKSI